MSSFLMGGALKKSRDKDGKVHIMKYQNRNKNGRWDKDHDAPILIGK